MPLNPTTKKQIVQDFKRHEGDNGSPEVQIALLTKDIQELTEHMQRHTKDFNSRHGLLLKVNRRNKLMAYLARVDRNKYNAIADKLGLRK